MNQRSINHRANPVPPMNSKAKSLLAGKVFCGHCGARLLLSTNGRYRKRTDGTIDMTKRLRYVCYGKTRKQTECDGQTGYTMHILDDIVDSIIKDIFAKMKGVSKSEVVNAKYANELELRKARLIMLNADYGKASDNLTLLKAEVVKSIRGESSFSTEMLSDLIREAESECARLEEQCADARRDVKDTENLLRQLSDHFDELISWAELYDSANLEKKKMVVNALINRIEVSRDYKVKIDFNFDFEQFTNGLDIAA